MYYMLSMLCSIYSQGAILHPRVLPGNKESESLYQLCYLSTNTNCNILRWYFSVTFMPNMLLVWILLDWVEKWF